MRLVVSKGRSLQMQTSSSIDQSVRQSIFCFRWHAYYELMQQLQKLRHSSSVSVVTSGISICSCSAPFLRPTDFCRKRIEIDVNRKPSTHTATQPTQSKPTASYTLQYTHINADILTNIHTHVHIHAGASSMCKA